ncbi:ribonuclease II, chloroplastic/mitochondrial [Quillaja saponaria]|uniref:Ribonuclease II, chloroplastic/mitochondrial n=1 Tax=Quillaja saponaria TaxID=32244 RepID=A0AAD7LQ42_QUISA|nr:ribonuclease II, chloroplastic/mitochondrial [Quillaja saponaria]
MMAVRAVHSCSILRSASSSPPLPTFRRCCLFHLSTLQCRRYPSLECRGFPVCRTQSQCFNYGGIQSRSVQSLVESVMEELKARRRRKRVSATSIMGVPSSEELLEDRLVNRSLQKGLLLEFKKDSDRMLLAVAQKPDGKKNWMVSDQNGVTSSIKPQQVTFIVPGIENFDQSDIADFIEKAHENLDPALLEFAWVELLERNKSVTTAELAEMIFGSAEPLESYCAHLLLSKDEIYFTVLETKGARSIYGPRPSLQVEELTRKKLAREAAEKELQEFVQLLTSAKSMPLHAKPPKSSWLGEEQIQCRIESLEAYSIDACKTDEQRKTAGMILKAMGLAKIASSAVNLLIDIGYFPVHVNLDLLKFNIRTDHSEEVNMAAESLLSNTSDQDEINRNDLTHLKVYAIDVDEADELDDALSATRLQDGRIKVWIHVADATRFVQPGSIVEREAMRRGTSVFLPTATYPMFPEKLAMEGMSLKQGEICHAVTVSVVLHPDGSIAECSLDNSTIKPTYMLTYESASELLHLNLEEEVELKILSEAATLRLQWRRRQGAIDTATLETRIKVANPEDPEPTINLYVENQADPAMQLVSEMMILCGEAVATFGSRNNIPLPYRGQPQSDIDLSAFSHLPEGPVRSYAVVRIMRAAEIDFRKPIRHGVMGLPGYVQFTSPIRRYLDLLAHYQLKAFLRGDPPPFSAGQLEGMASVVNANVKVAKRLFNTSLRYWILEHLRRQPKAKRYSALILKFIKDRIAAVLLVEVGHQASAWVSVGRQIGDEIEVKVEEAHPRDDVLSLKEVV